MYGRRSLNIEASNMTVLRIRSRPMQTVAQPHLPCWIHTVGGQVSLSSTQLAVQGSRFKVCFVVPLAINVIVSRWNLQPTFIPAASLSHGEME